MNGVHEHQVPVVGDFDGTTLDGSELEEAVIASLKVSGGCIIRNFVDTETVQRLNAEFRPYFDQAQQLKSDFWASETRRITGCMSKSDTYAHRIVGNDLWQAIGRHFLTSTLEWWLGDKLQHSISDPQLNNTSVFRIRPGAVAQLLHRDDIICHVHHAAALTHTLGRDYGIGLFVAGTPSTRHNGATRFIPGSHLWDYSLPPIEEESVYVELRPGDAFVMLAGCYHAGSANRTRDQERQLYTTFTGRGWCRQEENQYLANSEAKCVRRMPEWLQGFMGWNLSLPFMGWVGLENPIWRLKGENDRAGETYF